MTVEIKCPNCGSKDADIDELIDTSEDDNNLTAIQGFTCIQCRQDYEVTFELIPKSIKKEE